VRARIRILRGAASWREQGRRKTKRRDRSEGEARRGEERRILFYYFLFVVDVGRRNKQSSRSGGRENI
jgi:hypothetical protein